MLAMLSGTLLTLRARHGPPHLFLASPAVSPCRPDRMNFALLATRTGIIALRFQPLPIVDARQPPLQCVMFYVIAYACPTTLSARLASGSWRTG